MKIAHLEIKGSPILLAHPSLCEGWHAIEMDGRWTNGRALVPAELLNGGHLDIVLAATLAYPIGAQSRQRSVMAGSGVGSR